MHSGRGCLSCSVIAAAQPLSLQAHPSREQAEAGYAREQAAGVPRDAPHRTYRDGWPKPELLCALDETEALCGFGEPRETYRMFEQLGFLALSNLSPHWSARTSRPRSD